MEDGATPAGVAGPAAERVEQVRREFAQGWAGLAGSWGMAPITARSAGYLIAHGGPLTGAQLGAALGLSAAEVGQALEECAGWGLAERVAPLEGAGAGSAGPAWRAVDDHWRWAHRLLADAGTQAVGPLLALLESSHQAANALAQDEQSDGLRLRIGALHQFVSEVDRLLAALVRADPSVLATLARALYRQSDDALDALLAKLGALPEAELAAAMQALAGVSPSTLRRLLRVVDRPALLRLLGGRRP
jgi:DNA-binding transcriptional regulator GbsR (MarR family)